jgi:hypothetical protein
LQGWEKEREQALVLVGASPGKEHEEYTRHIPPDGRHYPGRLLLYDESLAVQGKADGDEAQQEGSKGSDQPENRPQRASMSRTPLPIVGQDSVVRGQMAGLFLLQVA